MHQADSTSRSVGIEYAHVYTDQEFSVQHLLSIEELHEFSYDASFSRIVLIDDYSTGIPVDEFGLNEFLQHLSENLAQPDAVVLESELLGYCPIVLDLIDDKKMKRGLESYHRTKGTYPCSLMVATWYLLRLGAFGRPEIECIYGTPGKLFTDTLVSILPEYFVSPETYAKRIIEAAGHSALLDRIEHVYFQHRPEIFNDWDDFDAEEYVERNYGRGVLSEDRQIIEFVTSALREMEIDIDSQCTVADIGSGPNLYPSLLISPYISEDGSLELVDIAAQNLDHLQCVLDGIDDHRLSKWKRFEKYIHSLGVPADLQKVRRLSTIKKGSIYELEPTRYDAVLSFFVGDSITDKETQFDFATTSLMNSLKPSGLFIVAHMIGSTGYFAGEQTFFPAVSLTMEQIQRKYNQYGSCTYRAVVRGDHEQARSGYKGMAVVVGRKGHGGTS
ncbi:hypothetical protein [Nocardia sp. NPDC051832]|uniref:hypothetical protein n=1 Tax=Nocardia sp. NPDC051832 TaxID=3155673 RepID=UPI00343FA34C